MIEDVNGAMEAEVIEHATSDRKPQIGDVIPADPPNYKAKKRDATKQQLNEVFESYRNRERGSRDNLLNLTRSFIRGKLYGLELDSGFKALGTSETADDWTQETLMDVWSKVEAGLVHGSYYAFVNRVVHFDKKDAVGYLVKERKRKVSLEVAVGEDAYTGEVDADASTENPAIYDEAAEFGLPSDFKFPKSWLAGIEDQVVLDAAELIISGWSMKNAAKQHGINEKTLSKRFERVRRRMGIVARAASEPDEPKALTERDRWYREQVEKRRAKPRPVKRVVMLDGDDAESAA